MAFVDWLANDEDLADRASAGELTIAAGEIEIDFRCSVIRATAQSGEAGGRERSEVFSFTPLSPVAQELVAAGGAEAIARASIGIGASSVEETC